MGRRVWWKVLPDLSRDLSQKTEERGSRGGWGGVAGGERELESEKERARARERENESESNSKRQGQRQRQRGMRGNLERHHPVGSREHAGLI